jgi:hypothetical protein
MHGLPTPQGIAGEARLVSSGATGIEAQNKAGDAAQFVNGAALGPFFAHGFPVIH